MLTRTIPFPEENIPTQSVKTQSVQETVDERGFYLYEWISSEELRMTLERDYLQIVKRASMPLAIICAIAGLIGFAGGPIGTILAVLGVLGVFYGIVTIVLTISFFYRSYLYTRGANVVITDDHYISRGVVLEKSRTKEVTIFFSKFEKIFNEPFLGKSNLTERKDKEKTELFDNLKEIASGGGNILQSVSKNRDSGGIVLAMLVASFLYAAMMAIVYYVGIFFISIYGRIFSWLANQYLNIINNTEHRIQTLFGKIDTASRQLKSGQQKSISLLTAAYQNEWKENLSGKLNDSFVLISKLASDATDESVRLRKILESSQYATIFNFGKYNNWVITQILEPIESILLLLNKSHGNIADTIRSLDIQITQTSDPSLQKPMILQKKRLELQKENFERTIDMLNSYRVKLI